MVNSLLETTERRTGGFLTREVIERGKRIGFDAISVSSDHTCSIARVGNDAPKVSKYSVCVAAFDEFLHSCNWDAPLIIIDEIGKMELLSSKFKRIVKDAFESCTVLATVPVADLPFVNDLCDRDDVIICDIQANTRLAAFEFVKKWADSIDDGSDAATEPFH